MTATPLSYGDSLDDLQRLASRLAGREVEQLAPCSGGGNNRVFRVSTAEGALALKCYGPVERDRDRLAQEYDGLTYLRAAGIGTVVPAPIAVDREARCALYEWIAGEPVDRHDVRDIGAALACLRAMHAARSGPGACALFPAAEAVFCAADLLQQIERRLVRLAPAAADGTELQRFLTTDVVPEFERRRASIDPALRDAPLPESGCTLSPSDFGFHNAIRRPEGSLTFIDFEYFGWDDPVKLMADFVWHPAMQLGDAERAEFLSGALALYGDDPDLRARFERYSPLIGIRWALIILNEFLPEIWARRKASGKGVDWEAAKLTQLSKARGIMAAVRSFNEAIF